MERRLRQQERLPHGCRFIDSRRDFKRRAHCFRTEIAFRHRPRLGIWRLEHLLDPARRADCQHPSIAPAVIAEGVASRTRNEDERSRLRGDPALSGHEDVLALQDVEHFVEWVPVQRRPTRGAGRPCGFRRSSARPHFPERPASTDKSPGPSGKPGSAIRVQDHKALLIHRSRLPARLAICRQPTSESAFVPFAAPLINHLMECWYRQDRFLLV
jgi:hypothetical protein